MAMRAANFKHLLNIYWSELVFRGCFIPSLLYDMKKKSKKRYRGRSHVHVNEYLVCLVYIVHLRVAHNQAR